MYSHLEKRLTQSLQKIPKTVFDESQIGLEKESLRVAPNGNIAQTPHPEVLGATLTHPHITTDYSEALLEFVTPPYQNKTKLLDFLRDCQTFVYNNLEDEFLWASSMPCVLAGETSIRIAEYGCSNLGKMKAAYRRGLGHRYGRVMQVIAGIHFNFSFSDAFWMHFQEISESKKNKQDFIAESYFNVIRNIQRYGWIIPYLFGASPAVCKSFLNGADTGMAEFDETTFYYPYATSLRMSDIGYQNRKEDKSGIKVNYDSVLEYVRSLRHAITTPHEPFTQLGVKVNGEFEQLNANLLQIENEYYSSVRPKQIVQAMEMPINALQTRGVEYIELRSLDINIFEPCGISEKALYFLETFLLFCLFQESPPISELEREQISRNNLNVARQGRKPDLSLLRDGKDITLTSWANEIFTEMEGVCALLDQNNEDEKYADILTHYKHRIIDPEKTPSAQILMQMRENKEDFFHFSLRKSEEYLEYFNQQALTEERLQFFTQLSKKSLLEQRQIEAKDTQNFEDFLAEYFSHATDFSNVELP